LIAAIKRGAVEIARAVPDHSRVGRRTVPCSRKGIDDMKPPCGGAVLRNEHGRGKRAGCNKWSSRKSDHRYPLLASRLARRQLTRGSMLAQFREREIPA